MKGVAARLESINKSNINRFINPWTFLFHILYLAIVPKYIREKFAVNLRNSEP